LKRGKVLFSVDRSLFNPKLAFYEEIFFGFYTGFDEYSPDVHLGYDILGEYASNFGIKDYDDFYSKSEMISAKSLIARSDDLAGVLETLNDSAVSLSEVLDDEVNGFISSSLESFSRFSSSFDFILFSSFDVSRLGYGNKILVSGIYEGLRDIPNFYEFWKNLLFGDSGVYEKFSEGFDEGRRKYIYDSALFRIELDSLGEFGLPFGYFSGVTRSLDFGKEDLGKDICLFSVDSRLTYKRDLRFVNILSQSVSKLPVLRAFGILGISSNLGPKVEEENIVLIPVRFKDYLILHTFFIGNLNDPYFFVDVRKGDPKGLRSDYGFSLHPNRKKYNDKANIVLDLSEEFNLTVEKIMEGVDLFSGSLSFSATSAGEFVEVGGEKVLFPRGFIIKRGSLNVIAEKLYIEANGRSDLSGLPPDERLKYISGSYLNEDGAKAVLSSIEKFENYLLSNLQKFRFIYRRGEDKEPFNKKPLSDIYGEVVNLRDKDFLVKVIETIVRGSSDLIRKELDRCSKGGEECKVLLKVNFDRGEYARTGTVSSIIIDGAKLAYVLKGEFTSDKFKEFEEDLLRMAFERERRIFYSKLVRKLCFYTGNRRNKVDVEVELPLQLTEEKAKDLVKRKSYLGFIDRSLRGLGNLREDQFEIYSLFFDLVPYDPSSVRSLYSKLHKFFDNSFLAMEKAIKNFDKSLEQGTVEFSLLVKINMKMVKKGNEIYVEPTEKITIHGKEEDLYEESFIGYISVSPPIYRRGKGAIKLYLLP
jgi:hypothetical protein